MLHYRKQNDCLLIYYGRGNPAICGLGVTVAELKDTTDAFVELDNLWPGGNYTMTWQGNLKGTYLNEEEEEVAYEADSADWSTYTYDLMIERFISGSDIPDTEFAYKWPYCATTDEHCIHAINNDETHIDCDHNYGSGIVGEDEGGGLPIGGIIDDEGDDEDPPMMSMMSSGSGLPTPPIVEGNLDCGYYETVVELDENEEEIASYDVWHWVEELGYFEEPYYCEEEDGDEEELEWVWYSAFGHYDAEYEWVWNNDLGEYDEFDTWTWNSYYGYYDEFEAWHFYAQQEIFDNAYMYNQPPIVEGNIDCGEYDENEIWVWDENLGYVDEEYDEWVWYGHIGGFINGQWVFKNDMGEYDEFDTWTWDSKYGEYDENDVWSFYPPPAEDPEPPTGGGNEPEPEWYDGLGAFDNNGGWQWNPLSGFYDSNGKFVFYDDYYYNNYLGNYDSNGNWIWNVEWGYHDENGAWHFYSYEILELKYEESEEEKIRNSWQKLAFAYMLYDYCNKYGKLNAKAITDFKVEILNRRLHCVKSFDLQGTEHGVQYPTNGGHYLADEVNTLIKSYHNGWRTVYTGQDNCWTAYRRDHKPSRMLAVNRSITQAWTYTLYYTYTGGHGPLIKQAKNSPYYDFNDKTCVKAVPFDSYETFVKGWNSMTNIFDVYVYSHGDIIIATNSSAFTFWDGKLESTGVSSILKAKPSRVYLWSCDSGYGDKEANNLAWSIAKLAKPYGVVRACEGGVSFTLKNGKYYARRSWREFPWDGFYDFSYDRSGAKRSKVK